MLFFSFNDSTVGLNITRSQSFDYLVSNLCSRFDGLATNELFMEYSIPGRHKKCRLESNDDLQVLFLLASRLGLPHVDMDVSLQTSQKQLVASSTGGSSIDDVTDTNHKEDSQVDWRLEMQQQTDLLPLFCAHPEKALLSAPWKNGITHVGQKFMGGVKDFRIVLSKYAVESGFEYVYVKNDKERVTVICKHKISKGCMWNVHARVCKANNYCHIRKLNNVHTCGAEVRTDAHSRMTSILISDLIVETIRNTPLKRPVDVRSDFKTNYGQEISYYKA